MSSVCHFETSAKNDPKITFTITRSKICHMFYYFESQFSFVLSKTIHVRVLWLFALCNFELLKVKVHNQQYNVACTGNPYMCYCNDAPTTVQLNSWVTYTFDLFLYSLNHLKTNTSISVYSGMLDARNNQKLKSK